MEEKSGLSGSTFDGVFFTEGAAQNLTVDGVKLTVEVSRQNANLHEVKKRLAAQVLVRGGNALVDFEYGQKSHSVLQQLFTFKWDSESWHGSGYAARL
ncbi:MAG: hypothetical protein H7201_11055 [Candidatus Saccharibacteria bacterium]|nr:hypothetical protein [Microbacteriaceae bacterium]